MREQESFRAALVRELPDKSKGTGNFIRALLRERSSIRFLFGNETNCYLRPAYVICSRIIFPPFAEFGAFGR